MEGYNNMDKINVGTIQFTRVLGKKKENIEKAIIFINEAAKKGAKIISLPELFSTGYFPYGEIKNEYFEWAENIPGPTTNKICDIAKDLNVWIIAPIYEIDAISFVHYNTAAIISPQKGVVGLMRKRHIPSVQPYMVEKYYYAPGNIKYPVFDIDGWKIAISICYDRHFPETFKLSALHGAHIVFSVNNTPTPRSERMWYAEIEVASSSNGIYIVQNNAVGEEMKFFGKSFITDPSGGIIGQLASEEGVLVKELEKKEIATARIYYKPLWDTNWSDFGLINEKMGQL